MAAFDFSKNLMSANQKIMFWHEWSKTTVEFKAFDLSYSETVTNDWEEVALPRRINRSYTWSGVIRKISLGWSMPAYDLEEAKLNMAKCSRLVRMMYPMTTKHKQITGGNPVWYLGLMNWIHGEDSPKASKGSRDTMLAGFPDSFNWSMIPADGFLYDGESPFPKNIKISMGYTVLLDDMKNFGWEDDGRSWHDDAPTNFPWSTDDGAFS